MSKFRIKHKNLILGVLLFIMSSILISSAFASIKLLKNNRSHNEQYKTTFVASLNNMSKPRTRAPEPQTMVLFGGGFIGMLISFVRRTYSMSKRIFDFFGSIVGLIILSPIMLIVALFVKLTSRGPILYSQIRVGKDGDHFNILKFRTMRCDAEAKSGPVWAAKNDNRLTPIGNFLRKAHLDELPQLINVLKGEMSIIGPRPERPIFVDQFKKEIPRYEERLIVKPGITGLAQVWHRYDTNIEDVKKKLRYDLLYIRKLCFWTDFNIILRTFRVVVTGEGAH